jgi:hypothetical protein
MHRSETSGKQRSRLAKAGFREKPVIHGHRLFGTPGQSSKEGLRTVLVSVDEGCGSNLLARPCSGRRYLLTILANSVSCNPALAGGGTECNSTN